MINRRSPPRKAKRRRIVFAPSAVEEFYNRELDDWRWIKEVPREELLKCIDPGFKFKTKPDLHQLACFILGIKLRRFLYFVDMGGGKSMLLLELIRYVKWLGNLRSALICVPNLINFASWEAQLEKHAPDLTYKILDGSKEDRYTSLDEGVPDVCLINYAGLGVYMADARKQLKGGKQKKVMVLEDARAFSALFNFVALDEVHNGLSTVKSLQYLLCRQLSWSADYCFGATGTPMGKEPLKLWPQFHVIDQGETLGASIPMFQAAYYNEIESRWAWSGVEYVFDKRKRLRLNRAIQHRSIRYQDKEFSKIGEVPKPIHIPVQMSAAQIKRNEELMVQAAQAREAGEQAPATFIRRRQTAAGFIAVKGEDGTRLEVEFNPNPKAQALEQFLLDLNPEEKLVVFHHYVYTGIIIANVLKRMKVDFAGVGHGYKDPSLQLRRFLANPSCRVFVANCQAGGTGVDGLQHVAHYGLFFESPTSPTQRRQAEKRLHRQGQKHPVHIFDFVARGIDIDKRALASIEEGRDLYEAVVNGKEKA